MQSRLLPFALSLLSTGAAFAAPPAPAPAAPVTPPATSAVAPTSAAPTAAPTTTTTSTPASTGADAGGATAEPTTPEGDAAAPASDAAAAEAAPEASQPAPEAPPAPSEPPPAESTAVAATAAPSTKPASSAGIFGQGHVRVGGTIGVSTNWFILGIGAGVFVLDGLEPHADATFWMGDPFLATLTPGIRYVFHMVPVVKPYLGAFYRHYFVDGPESDTDSLGGRAGVNLMMSPKSYVGAGIIYEHFLDSELFANPDQVYPEIMVAVAF